jgi:DNA-directed RNA polymerase specialized sigma24 family protein
MSETTSLDVLAEQLAAGQATAATALYERFSHRLIALARSRLDGRLKAKVDPEDVVQSALRSFFARAADGRLAAPDGDRLWGLLVLLTLRKCRKQARQHLAGRRDARREAAAGAGGLEEVALDREPTPEEAACLAETLEGVMAQLSAPVKRRVLEMSLQGYAVEEIAAELNYYERGVKRVRAEVRELLTRTPAE